MSRTKKGTKGAGYEYWGRRPCKFLFCPPGRETKRHTHRMERAEGRREALAARQGLRDSKVRDTGLEA